MGRKKVEKQKDEMKEDEKIQTPPPQLSGQVITIITFLFRLIWYLGSAAMPWMTVYQFVFT